MKRNVLLGCMIIMNLFKINAQSGCDVIVFDSTTLKINLFVNSYGILEEKVFINDTIQSGWSHVYDSKKICIISYFYLNGKLISQVEYFKNKSRLESEFKNGLLHGRSIMYDKKGRIEIEAIFETGRVIWEKKYNKKGELISTYPELNFQ